MQCYSLSVCCQYGDRSNASSRTMKNKQLISVLPLFVLCSLCATSKVVAQGSAQATKAENERIDSLKMSYDAQENKSQQLKDNENLSDLKSEKSHSRAQAKEAKRIEREANDAARKSRMAYRSEKQAQKSRRQADKQARKAAKARSISDKN